MATSREIRINITSALNAAGIQATKEQVAALGKSVSGSFDSAAKGASTFGDKVNSVMRGIGGQFGRLGELIRSAGIWGVAAGVATVAFQKAWDFFAKAAEEATKRAERAYKSLVESIKDGAKTIETAFTRANTGIDKQISRFAAATNGVKELTKAQIEYAKQLAIANGMDAQEADIAASEGMARADLDAEEKRLDKLIEMENERVRVAREAETKIVEEGKKALAQKVAAEEEYQRKREEYVKRHARSIMTVSTGLSGVVQTIELSESEKAEERRRAGEDFDASEQADKLNEKIKAARDLLAGINTDAARAAVDDAVAKVAAAEKSLETLAIKRQTLELSTQNKKAELEKKAAEESAKAAEEQARRDEAEIEAQRERRKNAQDFVNAYEEEARKDREKAERDELKLKADNLKKLHQQHMKDIDDQIRKAREEARIWEENAQRARGVNLNDFTRNERDRARGEREEKKRMDNQEKLAKKELDRLEANEKRGRAFTNDRDKARIKQLKDWLEAQDAKNNPALQKVNQLEQDKLKAAQDAEKHLDDIYKKLQNLGL